MSLSLREINGLINRELASSSSALSASEIPGTGYGVYNNWYQARNARRYTPHYKVKGEKDFEKAKAFAKDKFDELQNGRKDRFHIEDITSVNVFYTKRDVSYEEYREKMFLKPFTINLNHN